MPADAVLEPPAPVEPGHGWLPVLLPESARRVRVHEDAALAATLAFAGVEPDDARPDVEIGPVDALECDAGLAVVPLDVDYAYSPSPLRRAAWRVGRATATQARATRAARALRRRGYSVVAVYRWDVQRPLLLPGTDGVARSLADRLPQRAIVVGARRPDALRETVLTAALREAEAATGLTAVAAPPYVSGSTVVVGRELVVRVAVGHGRRFLAAQAAALMRVANDAELAALAPAPLAAGRAGLGDWTAESRLPGSIATPQQAASVQAASYEAAARLFGLEPGPAKPVAADAELTALFVPPAQQEALYSIAERNDSVLADVRGGFAHGDFWSGNLLVADGRLTGIVDWEAAGPRRLPLIDFLQHRLNAQWPHHDQDWGPVLVARLLPLARAGGDEPLRAFAARVGVEPEPPLLEALVVGYWLDRLAYQLASYAERRRQPLFLQNNARAVIDALT